MFLNSRIFKVLFVQLWTFGISSLIINLDGRNSDSPLKPISYCVDCESPDLEGSIAIGLEAKFGVKEYFVTGELIYCIPNFAEKKIINTRHFANRIVFVDRGKISFYDKSIQIQRAGGSGVLIADNGICDSDFKYCGPRVGSKWEGGLAAFDNVENWKAIEIPVILVTLSVAERFRVLMNIQSMNIPKLGRQNVTVVRTRGVPEL